MALHGTGGGGVSTSTTVNGYPLSSNVTLSSDDINTTPAAMSGTTVDVTKDLNTRTIAGTTETWTFSDTIAAGSVVAVEVTGYSSACTLTIPACYSETQQASITTVTIPANWRGTFYFTRDGTGNVISGEPVQQTVGWSATILGTLANATYLLMLNVPFGFTITSVTTKCASGTATATFKIDTTALGGTANSVSSTEQTQAHSSANLVAVGQDINMTISSASTPVDVSVTFKATRYF
jgi:hypothetical protein